MTENSTRHITLLRQMEALKREHQIRCSHYELQFSFKAESINCTICGKNWSFLENRGYSNIVRSTELIRNSKPGTRPITGRMQLESN